MSVKTEIYHRVIALLLIALFLPGCIREGEDVCEEDEAMLILKVVDLINGLDITDKDDVGDVDLFIFDPSESYVNHIRVPNEQLKAGEPVLIRHADTRGLWISAWGNLSDRQLIPMLKEGSLLSSEKISLLEDDEGYSSPPDDLFFGVRQINVNEATREVTVINEELPIYRKNGSMYITVLGLKEAADLDNYFFCVSGGYSGYNFKGDPVAGECKIKQLGELKEGEKYVTTEAIRVVHGMTDDDCLQVDLYKQDGAIRSVSVIASATEDDAGNPIVARSGETTNVLIDIRGADVSVQVEITPWNEIYNWVTW